MALVLFLAFFLLSHLLLPSHGQGNYNLNLQCPSSFNCGEMGSFQYPFYNDTNPLCRVCQFNCSGEVPKIQLGNDRPCEILERLNLSQWSATLLIRDQLFEKHLDGRRCENLDDMTIPSSPSITFTILHNITVFKCQKSTEFTPYPDNFFNSYTREGNCRDFDLYYTLSKSIPVPTNLPPNCKVIHLPIHPPDPMKNANPTALFSLVTAKFYIELSLTRNCWKCHDQKGPCLNENENFQCENTKQDKKKRHLEIIITGALIAGAAISMIILIFCFRKKFMVLANSSILWRKKTDNYLNVEAFIKNLEFLAPKRFSRSDIKKMTNSFNVKLGQGAFGSVYKGTLCNGNLVAVKVLNESKGNGEDFINEVASVGRTSHVNIVSLLGFCFEGRQRYLIYEFMSNGSLEKFIYDRSSLTNGQLGWEKLYQIAIGIARGLEYLHRGCNTRILHFDIKPHNILLDQDFCPKISDFGLAKLFPDKRSVISMSGMRGTPGYIAPELFSRNFGGISHKSDVYSYGMMALEMVGGRKNIEAIVDHSSEIYFPHWIYKRLELEEEALGLHGIVNEEENEKAKKMIIVGLWCIQTDPLSRPSMTRVLEMLEGSLESLQIPPKPFLSSPSRLPQSSTELSMTVE